MDQDSVERGLAPCGDETQYKLSKHMQGEKGIYAGDMSDMLCHGVQDPG